MRRYVLPAIVTLVIAIAWILVLPEAPVAQPVAFNHAKHGAVACVVCHAGVARRRTRGHSAGRPVPPMPRHRSGTGRSGRCLD